MKNQIVKLIAGTLRGLSVDMVQKANSGHPGLPLGMADVAAVLFQEFLHFNPADPDWINRDRFVLSGGHGSALLYALLHLYGYDMSIHDLKQFRQWGSKTPGHPEYREAPGVETTTGPLGQGIANAVGMAIAESQLAARFNKQNHKIIRHRTYVMAGDGDLQEGISHEALSLAGHLKLNRLILLYDSNHITIDGDTSVSDSTDVKKRFQSYGWKVLQADGHDYDDIRKKLKKAKKSSVPVVVIFKTIIGYGSPNKQNTSSVHGSPLGAEEVRLTKQNRGLPDKEFYVDEKVYAFTREKAQKGRERQRKWQQKYKAYAGQYPEEFRELELTLRKETGEWRFSHFPAGVKMATRKASGKILEILTGHIPSLFGGSADLTPSNNTRVAAQTDFNAGNRKGNYLHYGIREFAMGAVMNGMALHGGIIPYGGTFFVFSDYMRSAIRMAALMKIQVIYVFTHDSIGLGEDGSTHQPVEHLAALRAIPGLVTFRPMDANETIMAWKLALTRKNAPTALILSRQALPVFDRETQVNTCRNADKGAYVLTEDDNFDIILMASGSEVQLIWEAKIQLNKQGKKIRLVSVPSLDLFAKQPREYRDEVLPSHIVKRLAVEAGVAMPWYGFTGKRGKIISLEQFGASAPADVLFEKYGFTVQNIVRTVLEL